MFLLGDAAGEIQCGADFGGRHIAHRTTVPAHAISAAGESFDRSGEWHGRPSLCAIVHLSDALFGALRQDATLKL
jgi:hypothetical protein